MQNEYSDQAFYAMSMNMPINMGYGATAPAPAQYTLATTSQHHHQPQQQPPAYEQVHSPSSLVHRHKRSTSSRRMSPDDMIPLDAPTQPRRYIAPSSTSRKDVPSYYSRRGSYSRASEEEEDELTEEPLAPNATDQEKIEWRRRQNTLAARRSRKRKLQQLQDLQQQVEDLTKEREVWRTRALTLRQLLISHGILCPDFKD